MYSGIIYHVYNNLLPIIWHPRNEIYIYYAVQQYV